MRLVVLAAGRGSRLQGESGGGPKQLLEIGGATLLDRAFSLARSLPAQPLVVTRPEYAAAFARAGAEVLVEERPCDLLATLYHARERVSGTFCWLAGDMLFSDLEPLRRLVADHLARRNYASFLYCRSDRFKAKLELRPLPRVIVTRDAGYRCSIANFVVHSPAAFADLAVEPRDGYVQRALDRGEPILFREYRAPVFEIDTPEDLAAARRHFRTALPSVPR